MNVVVFAPGSGQINIRYQGAGEDAANTWGINMTGDPDGSWGLPLALPAIQPDQPDQPYLMRIVGHGWDTATPTYDLLLSGPGGGAIVDRLEGLSRYRTNVSTGPPNSVKFTAEFGGSPGYLVDDVRFINGVPPEDFPFELTDISFDADTNMITVTWSAEPGVDYYVAGSTNLIDWEEYDDSVATGRVEYFSTVVDPSVSTSFRVQTFPPE